jgi:hypothetical protein
MMANHPNRNWRRVMDAAAEAHLSGYCWPDGGAHVMTPDELREVLRAAFVAGYTAGRDSRAPRS